MIETQAKEVGVRTIGPGFFDITLPIKSNIRRENATCQGLRCLATVKDDKQAHSLPFNPHSMRNVEHRDCKSVKRRAESLVNSITRCETRKVVRHVDRAFTVAERLRIAGTECSMNQKTCRVRDKDEWCRPSQ
jgi:hypothetical protein